jgi:hypothetical protein
MSNPGSLSAASYEVESASSAWAENVNTYATLRIPTIGPIDVSSIVHEKLPTGKTVQYRGDGSDPVLGTQGGSFKLSSYLTGHGSSTAGATTITAYETFIGRIFGGTSAVAAASGTTASAGTATSITTVASGTFTAGSICFVGTLGDGRGNGQAAVVSSHSGTTLALLTGIGGSPSAADVVASSSMHFPNSSPTATGITGCRFLLQSANLCYRTHGVFPRSVSINGLNAGELPKIDHEWGVSAWGYSTATFPTTATTDSSNPAVVAAGSFFINDVGTATRATRSIRNFSINYTLGVESLEGPGGVWQYQKTVGAVRIPDTIKLTWTEDADAQTLTPTLPGYGTATTRKHILYTLSTAAGSRVAFYFPSVCIDNVAVQRIDQNINRLTVEATAYIGPDLTSELTRSPMRMAWG